MASRQKSSIKRSVSTAMGSLLAVGWLLNLGGGTASASHDLVDRSDSAEFGEIGPLIMTHKDAISSVLVWTGESRDTPKVCLWMRNSNYKGTDLIDPAGVSPDGGDTGGYIHDFGVLVRNGDPIPPAESVADNFSDRLDRSVQTRAKLDIPLDNGLCWDLTHPDAFANNGKENIANYDPGPDGENGTADDGGWVAELIDEDFYLNSAAFSPAGPTAGLNYDIFCSGNVQLTDGRILFVGGHDIDGTNGLRRLNIFDPVTETWVENPAPPVYEAYLAHPTSVINTGDPIEDHKAEGHAHPDPEIDTNHDPLESGGVLPNMKYQRWYPTAVTLPNGMVLILSGTDRIDGDRGTSYQPTVPEVYDPKTQTVIALENARKALAGEYPLAYVVQRGPREDDWVVAVVGEVANPECGGAPCTGLLPPTIDRERDANGDTFYLDVLGALAADPSVPGENHWEGPIATAQNPHLRVGAAQIWELKRNGMAKSMKVVGFGGDDDIVEMIDYADRDPQWVAQDPLYKAADDNDAAVGPDGNVLIVGGVGGTRRNPDLSLHYQMFDPRTGAMKVLGSTPVSRQDHTTLLLLPDASFLVMGSDRTRLVSRNQVPGIDGDPDMGIPVAQRYYPPYLFWGERPVIEDAPYEIEYGSSFEVEVSGKGLAGKIDSVVLIRPSPKTHKWDWGNRYVKLAFKQKKDELTVKAPALPGVALPGHYMLFVVSDEGVPGEAELVLLGTGDDDDSDSDSDSDSD